MESGLPFASRTPPPHRLTTRPPRVNWCCPKPPRPQPDPGHPEPADDPRSPPRPTATASGNHPAGGQPPAPARRASPPPPRPGPPPAQEARTQHRTRPRPPRTPPTPGQRPAPPAVASPAPSMPAAPPPRPPSDRVARPGDIPLRRRIPGLRVLENDLVLRARQRRVQQDQQKQKREDAGSVRSTCQPHRSVSGPRALLVASLGSAPTLQELGVLQGSNRSRTARELSMIAGSRDSESSTKTVIPFPPSPRARAPRHSTATSRPEPVLSHVRPCNWQATTIPVPIDREETARRP